MLVRTRITYRRLWLLGKLLRLEDRERYWGLLDTNDDPVALACSSEACDWCGMPSVFGCCTALCRCPECRKQGEFVQLRLPIVGGG